MPDTARQFFSFLMVGVVNTAVGYGTILFGMFVLGLAPVPANALGYAVGLCVSFVLNSKFTFQTPFTFARAVRFLVAFGISYAINLAVLLWLQGLSILPVALAQLVAMACYTLSFFVLSKFMVFAGSSPREDVQ